MKKVTVFAAVVLALLMASPAFARGGRGGRGGCGGGQVYISQCAPTCAPRQVVVAQPVVAKPVVTTCTTTACAPTVVRTCGTSCGPVYVSSCGSSCGSGKARGGLFRGGRCR